MRVLTLTAALFVPLAVPAASAVPVAKFAAEHCGACHGADGNSINPVWPKLAGQHAAYLKAQLRAFASGLRRHPLMGPQAAGLSDEEIDELAEYFASQKQK